MNRKQCISLILAVVLIAASALAVCGCGKQPIPEPNKDAKVLGTGKTTFLFSVVYEDGSQDSYEIHTDKTVLSDALDENKLITSDEGPYGYYVKAVNGVEAIYEQTGTYWALYVNGEYAVKGVSETELVDGASYTFKVEK